MTSGSNISADTGSEAAAAWASEQLRFCVESHSRCKIQEQSYLPSRVLDLGLGDSSGKNLEYSIKLIKGGGQKGEYACLSHCWGLQQPLKTTKSNLDDHEMNIPFHALLKTFKDAVIFARRLRIRYLWIDSLCIIQDDPDDWAVQSSMMAQIYQNSVVCLSSSCASDGLAGCFKASPDALGIPISCIDLDGSEVVVMVRRQIDHKDFLRGELPLQRRAWVWQERLLAPRTLHFGPKELLWECCETWDCECSELSTANFSQSPKANWSNSMQTAYSASGWHSVVEAYSRLRITYDSDIFPALSGVAKRMQQTGAGDYAAGLWTASLVQDLLWRVVWPSETPWPARPPKWRAPSWSWASVKGVIAYPYPWESPWYGDTRESRQTCEILAAKCSPSTPDPTGQISDGCLTIRGDATPVSVDFDAQFDNFRENSRKKTKSKDFWLSAGLFICDVYLDYKFHENTTQSSSPNTELLMLEIGLTLEHNHYHYVYCLLIKEIDAARKTYERVGLILHRWPLTNEEQRWDIAGIKSYSQSGWRRDTFTIV